MKISQRPSPNFGNRADSGKIDKLIFHYTGMKSGEESLARLCDIASEVSAHYFVDEDGTITQLVDEEKRAWHAGISYWAGETDINGQSIGIELQNPGHEWGYREFPELQIDALIELATDILTRYAIPAKNVLGHSDIAPKRKQDPGELFPWHRLAKTNIGYFPEPQKKYVSSAMSENDLLNCLNNIGYDPDSSLHDVVIAFQRHFRQTNIDGTIDRETAQLIEACAKIA